MSLKSQFKTNSSFVNDGVWFDVCVNNDAKPGGDLVVPKPATTCRIKLRRTGPGNMLWSAAWRKHEDAAGKALNDLTPAEDAEFMAKVYADAVVADWEHMQPHEDGVDVPFSRAAVVELLADPDWLELRNWIRAKADSLEPFQDKREGEVGN